MEAASTSQPGRLRANLLANFLGRAWAMLAGIAFVPLYLKFLGVSAYGLIGVYLSLLVVLTVAGFGLSATLSRETARLAARRKDWPALRDTLRTIEITYGALVGAAVIILFACAGPIAHRWIQVSGVSEETVIRSVRLMALTIAGQFMVNLYEGGLIGLERQVLLNALRVSMGILQSVGAILLLWLVSPTIETYFGWQLLTTGVLAVGLRWLVWKNLPGASTESSFRISILQRVWRYSAGMVGLTVTAVIIGETDKLVVSRVLPLDILGYYTIAWTLARIPLTMVAPIAQAFFPRLVQLTAICDRHQTVQTYHRACQFISVLAFPVLAMLCVYSRECLTLWLGKSVSVSQMEVLLSIIVVGTGAQALAQLAHTLQLANGWPMLSVWLNVGTAACSVPLTIGLTLSLGVPGAAMASALLSFCGAAIAVALIHRRFLPGEGHRWLIYDLSIPGCAAILSVLLARALVPRATIETFSRPVLFFFLAGIWLTVTACVLVTVPRITVSLFEEFRSRLKKRAAAPSEQLEQSPPNPSLRSRRPAA